jgi:hypothetical protein
MLPFKLYFESLNKDETELKDLLNEAKGKGIDVFIYYKNKVADLVHIRVPKDTSGLGTWFMDKLVRWADDNKIFIKLSAARKGDLRSKDSKYKVPTSNRRLVDFYKRFGFVLNKGRNKRYEISDTMYRDPR